MTQPLPAQENRTQTRVNLVHNPTSTQLPPKHAFSALLSLLMRADVLIDVLPKELINWIDLDVGPDGPGNLPWMTDNPVLQFAIRGADEADLQKSVGHWKQVGKLVTAFGLKAGESGLVLNGRVGRCYALG